MNKTAISLFSGAGGMDVGFKAAGFDIIWANDNDKNACETYRSNHKNPIKCGNIEEYYDELKRLGKVDLVFGGPPCQGFSVAGKMDPNDERSKLIWSFLNVVKIVQPEIFVMENVKALGQLAKWSSVRSKFLEISNELGYNCEFTILNSSEFNTPQARERVFFIGIKDFSLFNLEELYQKFKKPGPTVKEVLKPLGKAGSPNNNRLCNAEITIAANPVMRRSPYAGMLFNGLGRPIKVNGYAATLPASMGGNKTPIIDELELHENKSSWVEEYHKNLMAGKKPLGFKETPKRLRRLTIDECILLQTFPKNYIFKGSNSSIFRQIGNAVPCNLAEAVGNMAMYLLDCKKKGINILDDYQNTVQLKMFA